VQITTLGNFTVISNGINLTEKYSNLLKLWELFKYFITFRDELILPEKIINYLWPNAEYTDPKRTLRALIFRLRKILNDCSVDANNLLVYSHGCYKLETKKDCKIDTDEFENFYNKALELANSEHNKAIDIFKNAISLYKGEYLSETYGYDWILAVRNHYRRIYLQCIYRAADLLKLQNRFNEILEICEKALRYELFEEEVHYIYIEALAKSGKLKQARDHYQYAVEIFEREIGAKPTNFFNTLTQLLFDNKGGVKPVIHPSHSLLDDLSFSKGPVLCDEKVFKFLYQMDLRRFERYGRKTIIGLLTISLPDYTLPPQPLLKKGMEDLKQILLTNLRKSDVIAVWSDHQFVLNLPEQSVEQASIVLGRIQKIFALSHSKLVLHRKIMEELPSTAKVEVSI